MIMNVAMRRMVRLSNMLCKKNYHDLLLTKQLDFHMKWQRICKYLFFQKDGPINLWKIMDSGMRAARKI